MNRKVITFLTVMLISLTCLNAEYKDYQALRTDFMKLYKAENYAAAARLLERNLARFPKQARTMGWNLSIVFLRLKNFKKGMNALEQVHKKGQWFNVWALKNPVLDPYRKFRRFARIIERNNEFQRQAQLKAKPKLEIVVPDGFSPDRAYPLFIAFHGGGENIKTFIPQWQSQILKKEFIVAYPQSSQVADMDGYTWEQRDTTAHEVKEAYKQISGRYKLTEEVIAGGFSSGGLATLMTVFDYTIPVRGFVILCPALPENTISMEAISAARDLGIRGTLITTERDRRVQAQRALADRFKQAGLQYQFVLTPDMGHWFPLDMDQKIDRAILHIRNR